MLRASATPKPRLLIGENDPATRAALATQLSDRFEVVAQARDAQEAITLVELYGPDVALLEVHMPAGGGIHATREICRLHPDTAVCVFSPDEPVRSARCTSGPLASCLTLRANFNGHAASSRPVLSSSAIAGWPTCPCETRRARSSPPTGPRYRRRSSGAALVSLLSAAAVSFAARAARAPVNLGTRP